MKSSLLSQVPLGNITGIGPLGNTSTPIDTFVTIISTLIGVLTIIAALYFIVQIFQAGLNWISSGGDKQSLQNAQKRLQNAIIGLFITVAAYTLIGLVGNIIGINILNLGPILNNIHP
jgi:ABC-type dipeptide/oligopeptide/nickel transport system permease component